MDYQINFPLIAGLVGVYFFSVIFTVLQTRATSSERYKKYRLYTPVNDPLANTSKFLRTSLIIIFIACIWTAYLTQGYDWVIHDEPAGFAVLLGQVLAVLLIYDFMFYWVHRAFHLPFLMRYVHHVHHRVRFPTAIDDYYLHPIDTLWVTTLFFLSIAIIGPVNTTTFIATLFVWVFINNSIHGGLNLPHPIFKLTNYWARMHECHHGKNMQSNFGSIFPFWDMMFGTHYISKKYQRAVSG